MGHQAGSGRGWADCAVGWGGAGLRDAGSQRRVKQRASRGCAGRGLGAGQRWTWGSGGRNLRRRGGDLEQIQWVRGLGGVVPRGNDWICRGGGGAGWLGALHLVHEEKQRRLELPALADEGRGGRRRLGVHGGAAAAARARLAEERGDGGS